MKVLLFIDNCTAQHDVLISTNGLRHHLQHKTTLQKTNFDEHIVTNGGERTCFGHRFSSSFSKFKQNLNLRTVWNTFVKPETIANCFRKAGFLKEKDVRTFFRQLIWQLYRLHLVKKRTLMHHLTIMSMLILMCILLQLVEFRLWQVHTYLFICFVCIHTYINPNEKKSVMYINFTFIESDNNEEETAGEELADVKRRYLHWSTFLHQQNFICELFWR